MVYLIFIFGLFIGSFLNCLVYRLEKGESFLKGRSYCPFCRHTLSWHDLIPVLSFLILKGRCSYCRKRISFQYPLVELAAGFLFLLIFYITGFSSDLLWVLFISCFLIVIFVYDLKHYIIPDKVIYPLIAVTFLYRLQSGFLAFILSALFASGFFLAIVVFSKGRAMGFGDVKLAFFMGLFLGFPNILVALFFSFMIGAIIGVGLILKGKKKLKSEVPFGPFLVIGTLIAFLWGQFIASWYLSIVFL